MATKSRPDGSPRYSYCRKCEAERNRKWRLDNREHQTQRQLSARAAEHAIHPEKMRARQLVNYYKSTGVLVPQPCEVCGAGETYAHHDDYLEPLEVRWLCPTCHNRLHSKGGVAVA